MVNRDIKSSPHSLQQIMLPAASGSVIEVAGWLDPGRIDVIIAVNVAGICVWRAVVRGIGSLDFDPRAANLEMVSARREVADA